MWNSKIVEHRGTEIPGAVLCKLCVCEFNLAGQMYGCTDELEDRIRFRHRLMEQRQTEESNQKVTREYIPVL